MRKCLKYRGLTLVEAMVLLVIISIVAVAAGVGLQAVAKVPAKTDNIMSVNNVLVSIMEQTKANLIKNWPSGTWGGSNDAFIANGTSYTPAAGTALGAGYSTPLTGASPAPLTINNLSYQLTLTLATADPAGGTNYQPDFIQVTVSVCPVIGGVASASNPQQMVTYVSQP